MRRSSPLPAAFAGFVLTCFVLAPAPGHAREPVAAATPAPAMLVRAGDSAMSCEALAAEINQLSAADQPAVAEAAPPKKKKKGGGFLRILGHAAPFLGPLGMIGGGVGAMVASSAVGAASSVGGSNDADAMMAQSRTAMQRAMAGPSVESQRRDRLTEMFEAKRCAGAGEGNRTLVVSLGSFCSTIELHPQTGSLAPIWPPEVLRFTIPVYTPRAIRRPSAMFGALSST